ncbi:MAG: diguanylate cyclase [Candidatus Limnocylindrales bacterium]
MNDAGAAGDDYGELFARASRATTAEECEQCLADIERLSLSASDPADRGRLLMCRARVRSNQFRTTDVFDDTRAAMRLFEQAGEGELVIDAASWAAAHASRLGELSVASELATRSLLALEWVENDRLKMEIHNRLGIFCMSFLDYDRAIEQLDASLGAAERIGDLDKISRQLHNIADALLLAAQQRRLAHLPTAGEELARAETVVRELLDRAPDEFNRRVASHRLLAEVLCELGRPGEALAVLDQFRDRVGDITPAAQRAALAGIEARCLRLSGQAEKAVIEAERAVAIVSVGGDDHELMLQLDELADCQEAAGDAGAALATAREAKARMWTIHQRQTRQLVQEVWGRADFVRDQATLQFQATEASRRADEDALTGIGNRRILERFVVGEAPEQNQLALIVVDVDHFKQINDSFGHRVGDNVLRRMGQLLKEEMRSHQVAVRYGGDEFLLGLLGTDLAAAAAFAERLRGRIEELDWSAIASGLRVTASLGASAGDRRLWRAVYSAADTALYAAKDAGRNAVSTATIPADSGEEPPGEDAAESGPPLG